MAKTGFFDASQGIYLPKDSLTWNDLNTSPYATWDNWTRWYQNLSASTTVEFTTDIIDFGVGLEFHKKLGDQIATGDPILTVYHHPQQSHLVTLLTEKFFQEIAKIGTERTEPPKLIERVITNIVGKK